MLPCSVYCVARAEAPAARRQAPARRSSGGAARRSAADRRRHPRADVEVDALFAQAGCFEPDRGVVLDLSPGGAFVRLRSTPPAGTRGRLLLRLQPDSRRVEMSVVVMRSSAFGAGVKATDLEPLAREQLAAFTGAAEPPPPAGPLGRLRRWLGALRRARRG